MRQRDIIISNDVRNANDDCENKKNIGNKNVSPFLVCDWTECKERWFD